jgi:hypothetical protein
VDFVNAFQCVCVPGYSGVLCQTDISECSSSPCRNGGSCVDAVNSFVCQCPAGYSGSVCETDVNECASNPCFAGSTCVDLVNSWFCSCPVGQTGVRCDVDINECATNNGGCSRTAQCYNVFGGYRCSAHLVVDSAYSPSSPVLSSIPLVYGSFSSRQSLGLVITDPSAAQPAFALDWSQVNITVGVFPYDPTSKVNFWCSGLSLDAPINPAFQYVTCYLVGGCGHDLSVYMWVNGSILSTLNSTVNFPPLQVTFASLRRNSTGYSEIGASQLDLDTALATPIQFDGNYFYELDWSLVKVTYGPPGNPTLHPCDIIPWQSSTTVITCTTEDGSQGNDNRFQVQVGNYIVIPTDFILTFPVVPIIHRVVGCPVVSGNGTSECPTEGGIRISIYGQNFVALALSASVYGQTCTLPTLVSSSLITCTLPTGAGTGRPVQVVCASQQSPALPLISFANAVITSVTGCTAVAGSNQNVVGCARAGGDVITLTGTNFGATPPVVLIGSSLGLQVTQDQFFPQRKLTITVPPGPGVDRPVIVFQSGGGVGPRYFELHPWHHFA